MMRFLLTNNLIASLACTLVALRISACGANTAGSWQTVFFEDFEHVGVTNIGPHFILPATGDDVAKLAWTNAYSGNRVIKLRDGSGPESTLESRLIDVSLYNRIEFSFYYMGDRMEDNDLFTVEFQYNDDGPWYPAAEMVAGGDNGFVNNDWLNQCLQFIPYAGDGVAVDGIKFRFEAKNDDDFDIVYLDDIQLRGTLKDDQPTAAPTISPFDPNSNQCTDTTTDWPFVFVANFEVGGGTQFIGSAFENLVDGGSAKKLPGKGFEGGISVRLQDDTETSNIVSKTQDVAMYDRIEGTFMFQFLGMEAAEAQTADPDNLLVEVQIDGGAWEVAGDYIMDGVTYSNGPWNVGCFQMDLPENAATLVIRFVAGGDTGHTDFIYLDDISIAGRPKETMMSYECTDDSSSWNILMFESFEYGGGKNNIGNLFLFGGSTGDDDSQKIATGNPGSVSHTGSRAVKLKDNSDASRIYTVPLDVSVASRVELNFYFKFRGFDDQDNFFVERQYNGETSWTVLSDVVKMGTNYLNDVWYQHCVQFDLEPGTSTLSIQVRADGQEGDTDNIFVDDFELKYIDGSMS